MEKLFIVNKVEESGAGEYEHKESICVFKGTEEYANKIEKMFGYRTLDHYGDDYTWLEVEEINMVSDPFMAIGMTGLDIEEEKHLAIHFFKVEDKIYYMKRRPDRDEEVVKPVIKQCWTVAQAFANTLYDIAKYETVFYTVTVVYNRSDDIIDEDVLHKIAADITRERRFSIKLEFESK